MKRLQKILLGTVCASLAVSSAFARDDSPGADRADIVRAQLSSAVLYADHSHTKKKHHRRKKKHTSQHTDAYMTDDSYQQGYGDDEVKYDYARVVNVEPIVRRVAVETPERRCWDEQVQRHYGGGGNNSITPLILGGILGGVVGNQFGGGSGQDLLTVGGAILGASVGYDTSKRQGGGGYRTETETRCEVSYREHHEEYVDGYRVTYVYNGQTYVRRMQYAPGHRIKIRVEITPLA